MLEIYLDECNDFSDAKRSKMDSNYDPINLTLDTYDYQEWCKKKLDDSTVKGDDQELGDLPPLEEVHA